MRSRLTVSAFFAATIMTASCTQVSSEPPPGVKPETATTSKKSERAAPPSKPVADVVARRRAPGSAAADAATLAAQNPRDECLIKEGLPVPGPGVPDVDKIMGFDFSYRDGFLGCDHEGPRTQACRLDAGGFITWAEAGKRRYILADTGYVDILLMRGTGVKCAPTETQHSGHGP